MYLTSAFLLDWGWSFNMIPIEIIGLNRPKITLVWEDDTTTQVTAYDLRLACRCAFCVEETTGKPLLDAHSIPEDVMATHIELMGQYGMQIHWSDGHTTSIYSFRTFLPANNKTDGGT